jgi:hypothetical protein
VCIYVCGPAAECAGYGLYIMTCNRMYNCAGPLLGMGGLGVAGVGANMMLQRRTTCPAGQCRVTILKIMLREFVSGQKWQCQRTLYETNV